MRSTTFAERLLFDETREVERDSSEWPIALAIKL